jgi:hypothetical protein
MIAIYRRITEPEIRRDARSAIRKIGKWFKDNPQRRVCRTQMWYGRFITVKRSTYKDEINQAAQEAISSH